MSCHLLALSLGCCLVTTGLAQAVDPPGSPDPLKEYAKTLKDAGISDDPKALLQFFRQRTLSDDERLKLVTTIRRLGDADFDVREQATAELMKAGLAALPILRSAAQSPDDEIARRVERCLERIAQTRETERIVAAAHILASKNVDETVPVLLTYLPSIPDDEMVIEGIRSALIAHTKSLGKAHEKLIAALTDEDAGRRATAAQILGEALPEQRNAVARLLNDPQPRVRYAAGVTLMRSGDKKAVPALIGLLDDGPLEYAYQVEDLLCQLVGDQKPPATLAGTDAKVRKSCREAWYAWWQQKGDAIDLAKINDAPALKGLTLVVEVDGGVPGGRIWECGPDGKQRWEMTNLGGPVDVQLLPGGRMLVAEYYNARVTERNRDGKILWESPRLPSSVVSAQRLTNGNTLVATLNEVVELSRDGKQVHDLKYQTTVFQARRNNKGQTFVLVGNELIEFDSTHKEVRRIPIGGHSGWGGFDFLANGNFLIAFYTSGSSYAEVNREGKKVWEHSTASAPTRLEPTRVQRLRNGNTLVAGGNSLFVVEYDQNKKEVWKVATKGRPFSVLRY
jgi:HEAT repeat protein